MMYADDCPHVTYTERNNPHVYVYVGPCVKCAGRQEVSIPGHELFTYRQGKLIQEAFKSLSADEREFLQSGICRECWKKIFGG